MDCGLLLSFDYLIIFYLAIGNYYDEKLLCCDATQKEYNRIINLGGEKILVLHAEQVIWKRKEMPRTLSIPRASKNEWTKVD